MRIRRAMVVAAMLVLGCGPRTPEGDHIRAAAVATVVDSALEQRFEPTIVCISAATPRFHEGRLAPMSTDGDVHSATIAALTSLDIPVAPGSACHIDERSPRPTVEKRTGRQALGIGVAPPKITGPRRATVYVQHRFHGRAAAGYECSAVRSENGWTIEECAMVWIA